MSDQLESGGGPVASNTRSAPSSPVPPHAVQPGRQPSPATKSVANYPRRFTPLCSHQGLPVTRAISLAHGINEQPESVNRQRFLRNVYDKDDWHDKAMYTGIGRITGYGWPAFVGSPETVADALLDYYDLGARVFGIGMSIDAEEDQELARELFALLRAGAAERERNVGGLRPLGATGSVPPGNQSAR
jgi:hypothetical protein